MFDKNKNIKVGRDINIQIDKSNYENLSNEELESLRSNALHISNEEFKNKLKSTGFLIVFAILLFAVLSLGIPYLYSNYGNDESFILNFFQNEKSYRMICGLGSFMAIVSPFSNLWKPNDIENKQNEILKAVNTILKERKYLKK